jgi:surface polysaccharide O-acyltransferase-like enzyme
MSSLPEQTTKAGMVRGTLPPEPVPQATRWGRLFYLDNVRVVLTILVILHHLAVIYAANTRFYYMEPAGPQDQLAFLLLVMFEVVNQAYFMGCFFLISGYFAPGSFDRKGPRAYSKDRLLRLGIPLVAFMLVLSPITSIGFYQNPASLPHLTPPFTWQQIPHLISMGPLWFAEMLLFFCLGYVLWQLVRHTREKPASRAFGPPSYRVVGLFILVLATSSYLLRIVVPVGVPIPIVNFPSFAYFPQYVSFFILGIIAFRRHWFETIPSSMGKVGFVVAGISTIVLTPLWLSGGVDFLGYGHWQSAAFALWDSTFSVGICLALITFFRHFLNCQNRFGRFLSQQAFTVYIIHAPIIVFLALALRGIHVEQLLKFVLAATLAVPLCFALACLVRKIPLASRIL